MIASGWPKKFTLRAAQPVLTLPLFDARHGDVRCNCPPAHPPFGLRRRQPAQSRRQHLRRQDAPAPNRRASTAARTSASRAASCGSPDRALHVTPPLHRRTAVMTSFDIQRVNRSSAHGVAMPHAHPKSSAPLTLRSGLRSRTSGPAAPTVRPSRPLPAPPTPATAPVLPR